MNRLSHPSFRLLTLLACMLPLTACASAFTSKAIDGQVIEEGNHQPIPNAIVIAKWVGHLATFAHGKTICYHVLSTTTDKQGRYQFPAWEKPFTEDWQKNVTPEYFDVTAFKPGYERSDEYYKTQSGMHNIDILKPFTGTREERLRYIESVKQSTASCANQRAHGKSLIPLYRALYNEAKPLAKTGDEQSIADGFLSWIKLIEREPSK